ncbi:MAG: glutamate--cysteine ligase [Microbacteriaceae bacterium]|nr:glutamate--cysteine ligase [Microbacteriaceae bacterium]
MIAHPKRPFGVEEEYLLLDGVTGVPINRAAELLAVTADVDEQMDREFFSSQLETATPVCHDTDDAEQALSEVRRAFSEAAIARGIVLAGTGLPPLGGDTAGSVTPKDRYRLIESQYRAAAKHQYATGTHVHVEVPSPDAGIEVLCRLARWAPTLLALTANSPLWCGEPTGFASWRHVSGMTWPVAGYPLGFENEADYRRSVTQLIDTGVVPDSGLLTWVARLSDNYPTVELRIADAQLEASDAVAFAAIVRALVDQAIAEAEAGHERPNYATAMVNGATWLAARDGLSNQLIDPLTAESMPAFDLISRMLGTVEEQLDRFGDRARVDAYLAQLLAKGDPATRQLQVYGAEGVSGLLNLYGAAGTAAAAA